MSNSPIAIFVVALMALVAFGAEGSEQMQEACRAVLHIAGCP